jgi:hypothetical protein
MIKGDSRMSNPEAETQSERPESPSSRRPYVKPAFSCDRVFETTALTCSTKTGTPKNSTS